MDNGKKNKSKKGVLSTLLESMKKTGGCCGPDDSCGCSPKEVDKSKGSKDTDKKDKK